MPQSLYYRGDVKLMEIMTNAFNSGDEEKTRSTSSKSKNSKKKKSTNKTTISSFRSDQYYKIPFCNHGTFSKKLGILNTELQLMRSFKDTIVFLLWNDDIYFPSQTLIIVGSLATSIQSKTKDPMSRDGFCVLELTEEALLDGFVVNLEMGDGFLLIQTREHTLYGLGDNINYQLGIYPKNQNFYHEITEIEFEHGQLDFIKCGPNFSMVFTKSREFYITGEFETCSSWTQFLGFEETIDKSCIINDCQTGSASIFCLIDSKRDLIVEQPYVFDWNSKSIRRSGYFQKLRDMMQEGLTIQRVEPCSDSFVLQFDNNEWYWAQFFFTKYGSCREYFFDIKTYLPLSDTCKYEIHNVSGNKMDNTIMVLCKTIYYNVYNEVMEPYVIFKIDLMLGKVEKIECPFYGRSKWFISNLHFSQFFSLLVVNEEPNEWFMKRLLVCRKWKDVSIVVNIE